MENNIKIFGYGSLMWRPGFQYVEQQTGLLKGWRRGFWQGSPDHRGTPQAPGRVVTLLPTGAASTTGLLFSVPSHRLPATLEYLDHREQGGYVRLWATIIQSCGLPVRALTYVALPGNPHYLGEAPITQVAEQIQQAFGPSGANLEYYLKFFAALQYLKVPKSEWRDIPVLTDSN